ncbi:phage baseplate assembly protein V [Aquabacterium sp. A7-Y]|uniref:phage baseplate assembly protein V n=1 Tax=Aquabacterium sp. A7-Y TaxID=1349605 RepID=UPI00223D8B4E|nr:phage baseplate assembly protein V [Aquabacterium sp. A7-Y]MCW7541371.1 phage baseplate assembly protein V [Aquabacterium sp. A7-Y]
MNAAQRPMLDALLQARLPEGWGGLWHGVYPALVVDIKDPEAQGRVKLQLPWVPDAAGGSCELWARLATLMGGNNRGSWFIPDVDDEVLVAFEAGDAKRPYVIGALWNGRDQPPESMDGAGSNDKKVVCSRNGVKLTLVDQDGQEKLILETPGGQKITLKDGPGAVEIADSNGNSITLETAGITISASAKVTVQASQVKVSAGMVQVDAGLSRFSGVVQADTVIANSVISASYTPGAGNIW